MSKRVYLEFLNDPEPGDRLTFAQTEAIAEARRIGAKQLKAEAENPGLYAQRIGRVTTRPIYTPVGRIVWDVALVTQTRPSHDAPLVSSVGCKPTFTHSPIATLEAMERGARCGGSASLTIKGGDNFMVKVGESGEFLYSFNSTRRDRESFERVLTRCLLNAKK